MIRSACSTSLPSLRRAQKTSNCSSCSGFDSTDRQPEAVQRLFIPAPTRALELELERLSVQPIPYQFIDKVVHIQLYPQSARLPRFVNQFFVNSPMSTPLTPASSSPCSFQSILLASLRTYEKQTKKDLLSHPLAARLNTCNSPADILAVLQNQVQEFEQSRSVDERLTKWLDPTVNVLYAFSATLGEGVGLVFSPAKVIFAGAGVLLLAAKDVKESQDALIDVFERVENFFKRLEMYTEVPPTAAMTNIIVKIMVEVLGILAISTKEIKQGRTKKYLKKLAGKTELEDALKRLDKLTQEEARMAAAQLLKIAHNVENKVTQVIDDGKEATAILQQAASSVDSRPQITTSHAMPLTGKRQTGSSKEIKLRNGSPLALYCGSTANRELARASYAPRSSKIPLS
ncbi:hypothetical protein EDB86DRAFT_2387304 [Lactarius hatsudake]|nr:hypothetical protein EDB86DRAFT_2387304 [Lactarius hatsudake]